MMHVLGRATATMQRDPHLTEALTRAFVFADATVAGESKAVERHVTRLLARRSPGPALGRRRRRPPPSSSR